MTAPHVATVPAEAMGPWSDDDRARAWREAFDEMHQRAMQAEKIIRENWLGSWWRGVTSREAREIQAFLKADFPSR